MKGMENSNGFWCPVVRGPCDRSDCVGALCQKQKDLDARYHRRWLEVGGCAGCLDGAQMTRHKEGCPRGAAQTAAARPSPDPERVHWAGIFKVMEEAAELGEILSEMQRSLSRMAVVLSKLAVRPLGNHWDTYYAGDIVERLEHELGDVIAACEWFVKNNDRLSPLNVAARVEYKKRRFDSWRLTGVREDSAEKDPEKKESGDGG